MNESLRASNENLAALEQILPGHYRYLVVDPYAVNLIDDPKSTKFGEARLSFYSAFVTNAVIELYKKKKMDKIILFSDASFGDKARSTGDLMKEALLRHGVSEEQIVLFPDLNLDNTPRQVIKLSEFLKEEGADSREVAYIGWDYHIERIQNHLAGYHLTDVQTVSAVDVHKYLHLQFDAEKLNAILPLASIEEMEGLRRKISRFDKKGIVPRLLKPVLGGSHSLDNAIDADGELNFMYMSGKKRFKQVMAIKMAHDRLTREVE